MRMPPVRRPDDVDIEAVIANPLSLAAARMVLITQGAASQQLLREYPNDIKAAFEAAGSVTIDESQQKGHPESVSNVAGTTGHLIIRTGDPPATNAWAHGHSIANPSPAAS